MKIILVRHGYSVANEKEVLCGRTDVPLTHTGETQGDILSEYIYNNYEISAIYSSPLIRAVRTVKRLALLTGKSIITNPDFYEMDCGKWEMQSPKWIEENYPKEMKIWREDFGNAYCDGGESMEDVYNRAMRGVSGIIETYGNKSGAVVIATHGGVIRALEGYLRGYPCKRLQEIPFVSNASITVIDYCNNALKFDIVGKDDFLGDIKTKMFKI